jgi:hypothetical protein
LGRDGSIEAACETRKEHRLSRDFREELQAREQEQREAQTVALTGAAAAVASSDAVPKTLNVSHEDSELIIIWKGHERLEQAYLTEMSRWMIGEDRVVMIRTYRWDRRYATNR